MNQPVLSMHFQSKSPSDVRLAQICYDARADKPEQVINVGIGNVSLPMLPAMQRRMFNLGDPKGPFHDGVVRYAPTVGTDECRAAFKHILACEGFNTEGLNVQITDGGSSAMELLLLGVCGAAGRDESPLLVIDPAYSNYISFAQRTGRQIVTVARTLDETGTFNLPSRQELEAVIEAYHPSAILVIPYDNPTGQLYNMQMMEMLAELCVKHNLWMASDEAYRELYYPADGALVSIWGLTDARVPGIEGRRIGIETASKVWNACGLRIGALVTDNPAFHKKAVAEYTANLCANAIGQYIFGALAHVPENELQEWFKSMRAHYREQMTAMCAELRAQDPNLIVSNPDASIYTVIDVRKIVKPGFDAIEFVLYCAERGSVEVQGVQTTLLVAPMKGFYHVDAGHSNPGTTQFRISFVETAENMQKVPETFMKLLRKYEAERSGA